MPAERRNLLKPRLNRRLFLKAAGAAGLAAAPAAVGAYSLLRAAQGELPPIGTPYADLGAWALAPGAVSVPILVLVNSRSDNPFGGYLGEILRAEGLNCFRLAALADVGTETLNRFALVVLAEGPLDSRQIETLAAYVGRGGHLIAMRPEARLAERFGLEQQAGSTSDGYIVPEPAGQASGAFSEDALQFHGSADHYRLAGAQAVAWLSQTAQAQRDFPAVTVWQNAAGGRAVIWAFDLARSVALTRQGNPAWANQERDGRVGIRACDAFVDWIDLERIASPQADQQMRLFSRLAVELVDDALPLPRLWYFPAGANSLLVATGDAHDATAAAVEDVLSRIERYGGHMSVYYAPSLNDDLRRALKRARSLAADLPGVGDALRGSRPTPADSRRWLGRGHEFGLHPYVEDGLELGWSRYWQEFTGLGYGPVSPTVRTHRILWDGWVETARVQAAHGVRMNLDYYHYGTAFQKPDGDWVHGHFTGSGLPMRFVDEQGRLLNTFQLLTQLVDEHLMKMPWGGGWPDYSVEQALEVSRSLMARCSEGGYAALCAQFHIDPFALGGEWQDRFGRWLEGTLAEAADRGFPIWSAAQWLRFTEVRQAAAFDEMQWDPASGRLTFTLNSPPADDLALEVLLPSRAGSLSLDRVAVDGQRVSTGRRALAGLELASFQATTGRRAIAVEYR